MKSILVAAVLVASCGGGAAAQKQGAVFKGKAAWYGAKFHGKKTASGEKFDRRKLTAAHRTLPFGTKVKVTNLKNGKSVVVRINDRGPFGKRRRIIDVSEAAARKLGMMRSGVARVRVKVLKLPPKRKKRRKR